MENLSIPIIINNVTYTIKRTYRALMMFEILVKEQKLENGGDITYIISMFYCMLKANNKNFKLTFDEFTEQLDNDESIVENFIDFLQNLTKNEEKPEEDKKKVM